jgi:hypothetical protein
MSSGFKRPGKAKAEKPLSKPDLWAHRQRTSRFDWADVDRRLITAAIDAIATGGGAIMFGSAQGGRGMVLTIFFDGDRHKEYALTAEEFTELLLGALEAFNEGSVDFAALHGYEGGGE